MLKFDKLFHCSYEGALLRRESTLAALTVRQNQKCQEDPELNGKRNKMTVLPMKFSRNYNKYICPASFSNKTDNY